MKDEKTSYSKQENKKVSKIKFEEFPGNKENNKTYKENANKKKMVITIFIIFILFALFIGSSFLNKMILDYNDNATSKFSENKKSNISNYQNVIFKKLGYDASTREKKKLNGKTYDVEYAYRKNSNNLYDTISIYYDDSKNIYYLTCNLIYEIASKDTKVISNDINKLINNFINVNITEDMIDKLIYDKNYYDNISDFNFSMSLNETSNDDYYMITVTFKK